MCDKVKFQSLEPDQKYTVQQIGKPFKTKFGDSWKIKTIKIFKFQSLDLDQAYIVHKYDEPFKTIYGDSCILEVSEEGSDQTFELFATILLMKYIIDEKPKNKFGFTVKEKNGYKYPVDILQDTTIEQDLERYQLFRKLGEKYTNNIEDIEDIEGIEDIGQFSKGFQTLEKMLEGVIKDFDVSCKRREWAKLE